jgi:flagellar hook-length control protein FliK
LLADQAANLCHDQEQEQQMNNGNLLNSLLGITSANPAVTKATAAKARAESAEKFQQALEQVRPEVAARKPVVRKESPAAEPAGATRPAPKPATQPDSQQETNKVDTPAAASKDTQETANKTLEKSEPSVRDTGADEPVAGNNDEEQATASRNPALAEETQQGEGQDQSTGESPLLINGLLLVDPAVAGEFDIALESPESLLNPVNPHPLGANNPTEGDIDLSPIAGEAAVLDPSLLVLQPPLVSVVPEVSTDPEGDSLSPLVAGNQAALAQATSALSNSVGDAQSLTIQAASGSLTGKVVNELVIDGADAEVDVLADADTTTGENPDFLLLNSKAALNKLAEATMAAATLDKSASTADAVKPALVSAAAVEALTRLTEAQSPAARAFVVQTGVPVTVGSPQWSQAVGDKVLWLAAQNVSAAEIRLDPPELGPMQVKVSVNQDQASVTFTSPHPAVREALDQQLNRLREMFSEQGLNLVNVDVSDKSFAQREREQEESAKNQGNAELDDEELAPVAITQTISMRLVDHYA